MNTINTQWFTQWMRLCAASLLREEERLTELDRQIGDGDHGTNITRGFTQVENALADSEWNSLCEGLTLVAKTLMTHVGGASGPLYGTGFLRGGRALAQNSDCPDSEAITVLYEAIAEGISQRGNASAGDKTMLDAWLPAAQIARELASQGKNVNEVLQAAAHAAQDVRLILENARSDTWIRGLFLQQSSSCRQPVLSPTIRT